VVTVQRNAYRRPLPLLKNTGGSRKSKTNTELLFKIFINHDAINTVLHTMPDPALLYSTQTAVGFWATDFVNCVLCYFVLHSSFVFDPIHWIVPEFTHTFFHVITALTRNYCCHCNILQRCLLGETANCLLFVWTDGSLMMADVDSRNM